MTEQVVTAEVKDMIVEVENGKEVIYLKIVSGKHIGEILRFYYIRKKDGAIGGKNVKTGKVMIIGKGCVCEDFRKAKGLEMKKGGSKKNYEGILAKFEN